MQKPRPKPRRLPPQHPIPDNLPMKNTSRLLLSIVVLAASAVCASADPVKIKGSDLLELGRGLGDLDGCFKVVTDPRTGKDEKVAIAYEFTGKVRFAIARNLTAVKPALEALAKAKQAIGEEVAGKGVTEIKGDSPALAAFNRKWAEVLNEPITVDLAKLTESDLNLDRNGIPGTTLTALQPVIVELAPALAQPSTQVAKK
jgi:hypothetical protein